MARRGPAPVGGAEMSYAEWTQAPTLGSPFTDRLRKVATTPAPAYRPPGEVIKQAQAGSGGGVTEIARRWTLPRTPNGTPTTIIVPPSSTPTPVPTPQITYAWTPPAPGGGGGAGSGVTAATGTPAPSLSPWLLGALLVGGFLLLR